MRYTKYTPTNDMFRQNHIFQLELPKLGFAKTDPQGPKLTFPKSFPFRSWVFPIGKMSILWISLWWFAEIGLPLNQPFLWDYFPWNEPSSFGVPGTAGPWESTFLIIKSRTRRSRSCHDASVLLVGPGGRSWNSHENPMGDEPATTWSHESSKTIVVTDYYWNLLI